MRPSAFKAAARMRAVAGSVAAVTMAPQAEHHGGAYAGSAIAATRPTDSVTILRKGPFFQPT
jgi:hypothetical protein